MFIDSRASCAKLAVPILVALSLCAAVLPARASAASPNDCVLLAQQIQSLEKQLAGLAKSQAADLADAAPGEKAAIINLYKKERKELDEAIAKKRAQLEACVKAPIAHVPMTIRVAGVQSVVETDEVGADEPYAFVYAVDRTTSTIVSVNGRPVSMPLPTARLGLTGAWEDVDAGEYHGAAELPWNLRRPFWNFSAKPQVIADRDDFVFLVALMENDDGNAKSIRTALETAMKAILVGTPTGDRAAFVQALIDGMEGAIGPATIVGTTGPNFDDRVGPVRELRLSEADLRYVAHMGSRGKALSFTGDGGKLRVDFLLAAG